MILPGKHLSIERSLIGIGAEILFVLSEPLSISEAWEHFKKLRTTQSAPVSFDWFVKSMTLLFAIQAVVIKNGVISIKGVSNAS